MNYFIPAVVKQSGFLITLAAGVTSNQHNLFLTVLAVDYFVVREWDEGEKIGLIASKTDVFRSLP